ncbi:helix-turn-helix transcriptional regulator [Sphingobium sp. Z007]|uniref:helix-turn-helix transcriptional regulator n=1 Tax=Sphingobium sp. Z007 TaxID=627495 RepID=UPI000B4A34B0|nr:helix-turn-helix transcriptional regulator [Sphingobium sp. Z007]
MLVDSIYEAAVMPERWENVLDALAARFHAKGGMLIRASATAQKSICSPNIRETVTAFERTPLVSQNVRVERLVARPPHPGFLTDLDLVTEEESRTLPIYTDWLIPLGAHVGAATLIHDAPQTSLLMSLEGLPGHAEARASIPALDALRPHVARSAMLSARFHFERMRSAIDALGIAGVAAAIIDVSGRLTAANSDFERNMAGLIGARGRLLLPTAATAQFDRGLGQLPAVGASIGLRSSGDRFRVMHMIPVRGDARDIFTDVAAFLITVDPTRRDAPGTGLLQALFDLTPTEARIADAMAIGESIADIAHGTGTSIETVRTHLKAIFGKTGVNRQADLVAMLGKVGRPIGNA